MQIKIKKMDANMEVKSKGIEFEVRDSGGKSQIGDCFVTMSGIIWCKGKTSKQNGIKISWQEFSEIMKSNESKQAAVDSSKKT